MTHLLRLTDLSGCWQIIEVRRKIVERIVLVWKGSTSFFLNLIPNETNVLLLDSSLTNTKTCCKIYTFSRVGFVWAKETFLATDSFNTTTSYLFELISDMCCNIDLFPHTHIHKRICQHKI